MVKLTFIEAIKNTFTVKYRFFFFIRFYVFDILDNIFAFHLVLNLEFKLLLYMKEP